MRCYQLTTLTTTTEVSVVLLRLLQLVRINWNMTAFPAPAWETGLRGEDAVKSRMLLQTLISQRRRSLSAHTRASESQPAALQAHTFPPVPLTLKISSATMYNSITATPHRLLLNPFKISLITWRRRSSLHSFLAATLSPPFFWSLNHSPSRTNFSPWLFISFKKKFF